MDKVELNIESIRVMMSLTRKEMADQLGVSIDRYNRLATGESRLLATEFKKLHEISGLPMEVIKATA